MSRLKIDLCVMVLFLVLWFELPGWGVFVLTPLSLLPERPAALSWLALQALSSHIPLLCQGMSCTVCHLLDSPYSETLL